MKKINVKDLKPGMKFTHAVYISPTNMLVGAQMPLTQKDIDRLKRWNIKEVETAGEIMDSPEIDYTFNMHKSEEEEKNKLIEKYKKLHKIKTKFLHNYENNVDEIIKLLRDVKNNKTLNNMKIYNIASNLISEVVNNSQIYIYFASKISDENSYLAYHLVNATIFTILIGHLINLEPKKLINLAVSSLVFDIGMAKIPLAILVKKEKLTPKELNIIKLHTIYGYKILIKDASLPSDIAIVALQHHEQFDGNGYPRKLKSDQIDLFSRIVAIADTFEAMTKKRSYRDEFLSYEAMKNILNQSKHKFDPKLLRVFLSNMSIYPIGSLVKLNTNAIGVVVGCHQEKPLRPVIKLIIDEFGDRIEDQDIFIDLSTNSDLYIVSPEDESKYNLDGFEII